MAHFRRMFKKKCPTCVKMISYLLAQAPASLRRCQTCSPCTLTTAADCAGLFLYQTSWWDGHFMGSGDKEAQVMVTHAHIHTLWQSHARVRLLPPNQPVRRRREHRARDGVSKSERESEKFSFMAYMGMAFGVSFSQLALARLFPCELQCEEVRIPWAGFHITAQLTPSQVPLS